MHELIRQNAKIVSDLNRRVNEEFRKSPHGPAHIEACRVFQEKYDDLAFPGGYNEGLSRLREGDQTSIEAALAFLEVRPYFFRSGYLSKKLTRLLKHVRLSTEQSERFRQIRDSQKKMLSQSAEPTASGDGSS